MNNKKFRIILIAVVLIITAIYTYIKKDQVDREEQLLNHSRITPQTLADTSSAVDAKSK